MSEFVLFLSRAICPNTSSRDTGIIPLLKLIDRYSDCNLNVTPRSWRSERTVIIFAIHKKKN